ncbi:hypothetical protein EV363DRAFT_1399109 [Boletus edulis]|nr:hypothetical protein EV363DRAFT_1399109 [Boletus edulis]
MEYKLLVKKIERHCYINALGFTIYYGNVCFGLSQQLSHAISLNLRILIVNLTDGFFSNTLSNKDGNFPPSHHLPQSDQSVPRCYLGKLHRHDAPVLVTVPFEKGILRLDYWVHDPRLVNYYITHTDMPFVGVHQKTFKQYPLGTEGVLFEHAYSVFYLAQGVEVPINHALLRFCAGAADHRLLCGNVMILKHHHSSAKKFEDMTSEDMGLVCSTVGTAAVRGQFQNVDRLDLAMNAPIEL